MDVKQGTSEENDFFGGLCSYPRDPNTKTKKVGTGVFLEG